MKNITITLDDKTAAWVRVHAAKHGMSVSRLVGEMLQQCMPDRREYDEAMRRFLSKKPVMLKGANEKYPTRDELYDRGRPR